MTSKAQTERRKRFSERLRAVPTKPGVYIMRDVGGDGVVCET